MSIREYIINNFKDDDLDSIFSAINSSIDDNDEVALPGLGVFFTLLWEKSSLDDRKKIVSIIDTQLKK